MTLTVNLDKDVFSFTSEYAESKGISMSAAISELIRRAEHSNYQASPSSRLRRNEHGYLVIASTGDVLTPEMVNELLEDEIV